MKDLVLLKKCKRKYSGKKMHSEDQKKLGLWLASRQWLPHKFGTNDCCTLLMHYHDHMFGTNTVDEIYGKYKKLAMQEKNVIFLGRLATYKYLDMWMAIKQVMTKLK